MADIASGSKYMAGADKAAAAIESIYNTQIATLIDQVHAEGTISNARRIELKKLGQATGAKIVSLALGYHDKLTNGAKDVGIDVPPPSDGTAEVIAVIEGMVSPLSGGGR